MVEYIEVKGKVLFVKMLFDYYYYGYYKDVLLYLKGSFFYDIILIFVLFDNFMFIYYKLFIVVMIEFYVQGVSIGEFCFLGEFKLFIDWLSY